MYVLSRGGGPLARQLAARFGAVGMDVGVLGATREELDAAKMPESVVALPIRRNSDMARHLAYATALVILPAAPGKKSEWEEEIVAEATTARTPRIIRISMYGADVDARHPILQQFGQVDQHIIDSGIPYTILRPHMSMQDLLLFAPGVRAGQGMMGPAHEPAIGFVDIRDIADAVAAVLTRNNQDGQIHIITGPRTWTIAEVASALEEMVSQRVPVLTGTGHDIADGLEASGVRRPQAVRTARLLVGYGQESTTRTMERITGVPPHALEMFLNDHRAKFGGQAMKDIRPNELRQMDAPTI